MALDLMSATRTAVLTTTGFAALAMLLAGLSAPAQAQEAPRDAAGRECGALQQNGDTGTNFVFRVVNRCELPLTLIYHCSPDAPEQRLDLAAGATQSLTCVKTPAAAGQITYRFASSPVN